MNKKILISQPAYNKVQDGKILQKYRERYDFESKYEILDEIDDSSHGTVFSVIRRDFQRNKSNGIKFAAKPYAYTETTECLGFKSDFIEIDLLSRIEHPNILKIVDIVYDKNKQLLYTISALYSNDRDLKSIISQNMNIRDKVRIAHEIISCAKFLWDNDMVLLDFNIDMFKSLSSNVNVTCLTKLKNIVRGDEVITFEDVNDRIGNIKLKSP
jgi:hypothetical protein